MDYQALMGTLPGIFFTSWLVGFSGAMSPGPVSAVTVVEGARRGFWAGPGIAVGHGLVEVVLVALLASGLGGLLQTEAAGRTLAVVGGLALMGFGLLTARGTREARLADSAQAAEGLARWGSLPAGVLTTLSNPFWLVWWATIGAAYLAVSARLGLAGLAAFYVGHWLADLSWGSFLSGATAGGRRWLSDRGYRWLLVGGGAFLVAFGGVFVLYGMRG